MYRNTRFLVWLALIFVACGLFPRASLAQPTFTNPEVIAININGAVSGTDNTTFIFRVRIDPVAPNVLTPLFARSYLVGIVLDSNNPVAGPYPLNNDPFLIMVRDPTNDAGPALGWKACVPGAALNGGSLGSSFRHSWSIVARNTSNGGPLMNGTAATANANVDVYTTNVFEIMPVDANFLPDKRLIPGQPGNGLRIDPADPTSPNDGGSAGIYTWRVRLRNFFFSPPASGGLSPQFWLRRDNQEWRDVRGAFDTFPNFVLRYNSGVTLVLVSPDGTKHFCPMEIDPDAAGQAGLQQQYYSTDPRFPFQFYNVRGDAKFQWNGPGVFYRYRMLPSQYIFNHGPLRGEGPFTVFGGPTLPDSLPAIPIGAGAGADGEFAPGSEVIGRPFANQYTSFAGPDRAPFAPPFPLYTDVLQRSGQWKYYYQATADLRPPARAGFPDNFICPAPFFPNDVYGADPNAYNFAFDSDTGPSPGDPSLPYIHPMVTPMLSDGGWTDDLPENNAVPGASRSSHRSRVTTKTRVRFMVRATQTDNNRPPLLVRVFIDGTDPAHSHPMQILPVAGNNDYTQGVIYFYDTTFVQGQEGRHWCSFEADDGIQKSIWPRRDTPTNGTGDGRYPDLQALLIPAAKPDPVDFGTGTIGKNFLDEPYVNNPGVLLSPSVTPPSGSQGQAFTYVVNFFDADADEPLDGIVNIDGIEHRMSAVDANPTNFAPGGVPTGRKYRFILNALAATPSSQHTYFFKFRDNWNRLSAYNISPIRREFGQWTTLPPGDDDGTPASVISGPTIIGDRIPELVDASFTFSDPAKTPATLFDFVIRYKDLDNDAPATIKVYLSSDGGATYPLQFALVKAENSNNYTAGVQYHLATRINLPVGTYRYKFVANDGVSVTDQTLEHVGSGANAITDGTAHGLTSGDGINFIDPNGTTFKKWFTGSDLFVWRIDGTGINLLTQGVDYAITGPELDTVTLASAAAPGATFKASYFYLENIGPTVVPNTPPTLTTPIANPPGDVNTNDGTLTPLQGSPSQTFNYAIKYTDANNQAPAYVNLVIDTNTTIAMVRDPAVVPPIDFTRGVKYLAAVLGSTIGNGTHTYHFEASDGADLARYPAAPADLNGPKIADIGNLQLPPFGTFTDKPIVPFPKGKSNDNYLFTVVYQNANGLAPSAPIEVRISDNGNPATITAITLNPIDPIGPNEYKAGVRYQIQLTAPNPPLTIGQHDVVFAFNGFGAGTAPLTLTVNGPPVLSNPLPASGGVYSQAADITFSVLYKDPNNDVPAFIRVIIDQGSPTSKFFDLTPAPGQTPPLNHVTGVTYQAVVHAKDLTIANHTFHFTANDGTEDAIVVPIPDSTFAVIAALPPVLSEPGGGANNNNGTLTPLSGARSAVYTYSVKYTHPQNVAPQSIQVIIDTGTANQLVRNLTPTTAPPFNYSAGVIYSYSTLPNELNPGPHTYYFKAADLINTATLYKTGTTPYDGPTINNPPALSAATVSIQGTAGSSTIGANNTLTPVLNGNIFTKFIFRVKYADPDNVAPGGTGYVRVVIDGVITVMHQEDASIDFAGGVFYVTDPITLTPGQKTFHFEASDGSDPSRLPVTGEVSGITINNLPVLEAPNAPPAADDGTLSPRVGPLSTTFTYKIVYKHPDNLAPASVKVIIDGTAYNMQKIGAGTNFIAGVIYQYTLRFASGTNHTYRFEAVDSVSPGYTAKYPVDGTTLAGPTINVPTFTAAVFNPNPGIAGSPMTVSSQLLINPQVATAIAIKYTKPDGTGVSASANTAVDGTFSNQFTPDQTGDWKVEFSWAGQPGVYDPVTTQFTFKVKGFTISLNAGELDMIAEPLIPVTPDPSITFGTSDTTGNPLPVTVLNLIKWDPSAAPAGRYDVLNQDATFPGITGGQSYWVRPDQSVTLNLRGKLWDQTQPYSIPLQPGWNMIGSPFLSDINWGAAKVSFQGQTLDIASAGSVVRSIIWTYDKSSGGYVFVDLTGAIRVGRGYWVRAFSNCSLILAPAGARSATISRDAVDRSTSIQIMARSGNRADQNTFVPLTGSTQTRMALMEKPPYVGSYVSVRLLDPEKVELSAETRAAAAGQTVIPFQVETDKSNADVTVQFPNVSTLGRKYEVTLVDLTTGGRRSLGTNSGLTFNTGDNTAPRKFALLVAPNTINSGLHISDIRSSGRGPAGTTFTFNLSSAANIRAQIVGGTGSPIRDLAQGRAATRGANTLLWDGKNTQGAAVPAGAYVLKLTATDDAGHQVSAVLPVVLVR